MYETGLGQAIKTSIGLREAVKGLWSYKIGSTRAGGSNIRVLNVFLYINSRLGVSKVR